MNKEELLKEFNDKVEELKQELLEKLEQEKVKEKKPFEVELPRKHDILYYIAGDENKVYMTDFYDFEYFKNRFLNGYYFKTKEEAEQHLKEQRLLFKIKKWAEIHNEGWKPDWRIGWDAQHKYYIYYNYNKHKFKVAWVSTTNNFKKLPYFKTREIAQACIEEFGEKIKEVLC